MPHPYGRDTWHPPSAQAKNKDARVLDKTVPPSVAGPATHESPAKSRSLAGSESDQIGLGMPDIQWHGDSPLG